MGHVSFCGGSVDLSVPGSQPHIYGVEYNPVGTPVWVRTDFAADFSDPVAYYKGVDGYGSPFDDLMPWSGMVRSTDPEVGEVVAIPKFWYKCTYTETGLKIQVADSPVAGFFTSPAHSDRGDGYGERDIVYVGRYHCRSSDYKSVTRSMPKEHSNRSTARTDIHALGEDVWQYDMAMWQTIQILYLVEYANGDCQTVIGGGCSSSTDGIPARVPMGGTDSIPYHTGNMGNAHNAFGTCQYRNIEGLWDNVRDWLDGCRADETGIYAILNPNKFSDTENGVLLGKNATGYIMQLIPIEAQGVQWLIPFLGTGGSSTGIPDAWSATIFNSSTRTTAASVGGANQTVSYGLFHLSWQVVSNQSWYDGCRLMILPAPSDAVG